ncbi:MAG: LuxR C-terminal-related transcriptional regulator, partial [Coriobacteriales bacterium]|nr:LuxR C-terminal-related transcriptional regulator [Coriobacteriales bacterium]
ASELLRNARLSRIDENELLFTRDEVVEYFDLRGIAPSKEVLNDVCHDTEGLPFAVAVAARILERSPGDRAYIHTALRGSFEQIIETQFFSIIPEELKRFLLKLSLVQHLSPELISEIEADQSFLEKLVRATSLIRYDHYMHVYRLHHLLLSYLKERRSLLTEDERLETYRKAAHWCAENGYRLDALRYYHEAKDYGAIIALAYTYPLVMPLDVAEEMLRIFEGAPEEVLDSYPAARVLYARLILTVGRVADAIEWMLASIALLEKRPPSAANSRTLMGLHNNLGFAKLILYPMTGDCGFVKHFEDALRYHGLSEILPVGGYQIYNVGPYAFRMGRDGTDDPEVYIEAMRRAAACTTITMRGCMHGIDSLASAEYALFSGRNSDAEGHALKCITAAHEYGQFEIESRALFVLIRVYLQMGRYEMIMGALARLESLTEEPSFTYRHLIYEVISSWFYAIIGELGLVENWLKSEQWSSDQNRLISGIDDFARARYYLAQKDYKTLLAFVENLVTQYGVMHFIVGRIGASAMKAVCHMRLGNREEAFAQLRETYTLAHPLGLDTPLIELGAETRSLINAALKASVPGIPVEWLEKVRGRATTYTKRVTFIRSCYQDTHSVEVPVRLSDKELELLRDLTRGLSRAEISLAHSISINTVKSMLQIIYDKLGAESAMDAIRIATTRRLL